MPGACGCDATCRGAFSLPGDMASSAPGAGSGGTRRGDTRPAVVVDPEPFPAPRIAPGVIRDCQVLEGPARPPARWRAFGGRSQESVRWLRCLVSAETGRAYCFTRTLRECIFGVVRHGVTLEKDAGAGGVYRLCPSQPVAIKCVSKQKIEEGRGRLRENPIDELAALQMVGAGGGHQHVQRLLECLEDDEAIYAVSPFYQGGELFAVIEARGGGLPEARARTLFSQILSGLAFMHDRRLCHRDMSLENILVDGQDGVIIDMGMCLRVPLPPALPPSHPDDPETPRVLLRKQGQCGKITYMDPVVLEDKDFDGFAVDMWACGVILFILLAGVPPLELPALTDPRYRMIQAGKLGELMDVWEMRISREAKHLLESLLKAVPEERAKIEEVIRHPWLTG